MALMCAACGTDNRDEAKFCKGCGARLVASPSRSAEERQALDGAWRATVQSALEQDLRADDLDAPTVIVPSRAGVGAPASRPMPLGTATALQSGPRRIRAKRIRARVWLLSGAVLLAAAAGAGYAYRAGALKKSTALGAVATATPAAVPSTPSPTTPSMPAPSAAPLPDVLPPEPMPAQAQVTPEVAPAPPRKARKVTPTPTPAPSPAVVDVPPQPMPEAPPPAVAAAPPLPPPSPQSACGGRGFVGTAQCMVTQCARAEFAAHAQCEPVRRQQRIDEEKRNPLNAS